MQLVDVTKEEFFRLIYDGNLDVHPNPERDRTVWEYRNRVLFGISEPGYMGGGKKTYRVARY